MDSTVKLVFQSIAAGSGFATVNAQTAQLQQRLGKLAQGAQVMGRAFGNLGGVIGSGLGMLLQGGVWGAAATAAVVAIDKISSAVKRHNELLKDARLAARGLSREYFTAEFRAERVRKRVERWRKAAADAAREEAEAQRAAQAAAERRAESQRKCVAYTQQYYALEDQIALEKAKAGLSDEREVVRLRTRVKLMLEAAKAETADARRGVDTARANGGDWDYEIAKQGLRLAEAREATARAEARRLVEDYRKARQAAEDAAEDAVEEEMERMRDEAEAEAERQRKREQAERKAGEIRKAYGEAMRRIEEQIAAKRAEAARLEENAARARGVSFGDWARGERDRDRQARAEARKQANRERQVDDEIAKIEGISPRARSTWHRQRLALLKTWKANQDPANNPAAKAADGLERKRDALLAEQNKTLDRIASLLEETTKL